MPIGFTIGAHHPRKPRKDKPPTSLPHQAESPNHVWACDILFTHLVDGRRFKTFSVVDEFTHARLGIWVATSILAGEIIRFLNGIMQQRRASVFYAPTAGANLWPPPCKLS